MSDEKWLNWRAKVLVFHEKTRKQLQKVVENLPKYPDDVGGMYPYEIQMYSAEVEKVFAKLKEFLESLK